MAFQPHPNNLAPQMVFDSLQTLGKMNFAQEQQDRRTMGNILTQTAKQLSDGIAAAGSIFAANKAKLSNAYGKIDALSQIGYLPPEEADKLATIKDPDKLAGSLAVIEQQFQNDQIRKRQMDHVNMQLMAGRAEQAASRTGTTTTLIDPVSGRQVGAYFQNDRQVVPFDVPIPAGAADPSVRKVQVGPDEFMYVDQAGKTVNPNMIAKAAMDPAKQAQVTQLQTEKAYLEGEAAKGRGDSKDGADWWPWSQTINQRLAGTTAQLQSLQGGNAPAKTPPATGPVKIATKEEYEKLPSGTEYIGPSGKLSKKP